VHHGMSPLKILQQNSFKRQVMKLGEEMVKEVHEMFSVEQPYITFINQVIDCRKRSLMVKSACLWMCGHPAISLPSWQ